MPYTRDEFLEAGIDPDSREAYEINQAAYEEEARAADPTYGTVGQHSGPMDYYRSATRIFDPRQSALPYLLPYASLVSGPATTGSLLAGTAEGAGTGAATTAGALEAAPYVLGTYGPAATGPALTPLVASTVATGAGALSNQSEPPTRMDEQPVFRTTATEPAPGMPVETFTGPVGTPVPLTDPATVGPQPPAPYTPADWQGPVQPPPGTPFAQTATGKLLKLLAPALVGTLLDRRAADTARDAAAIQRAATDRALSINEQVYRDAQGNLAPYTNLGSQSANTLAGLMGFTPLPPSAAGGTAATDFKTTNLPPEGTIAGSVGAKTGQPGLPLSAQQFSNLSTLARSGLAGPGVQREASQQNALARTQSSQPQTSQPRTVRMRAPDGRIVMVPADRVADAQHQGGMVV